MSAAAALILPARPAARLRRRVAAGAVAAALAAAAAGAADESARLAKLLRLAPGAVVADVGAGDGEWARALAELVGPGGRVFATEVDPDLVERLRAAARADGLGQLTAVQGSQEATGLAAGCCDAVLLRLVYHHFTDPATMRADLARALRPGGVLVIVDTVPQAGWRRLEEVPERGGHGIRLEDLVAEMIGDGWREVERRERWMGSSERFAVVFRPSADGPP